MELIEAAQRMIATHPVRRCTLLSGLGMMRAGKVADDTAVRAVAPAPPQQSGYIYNPYLQMGIALIFLERVRRSHSHAAKVAGAPPQQLCSEPRDHPRRACRRAGAWGRPGERAAERDRSRPALADAHGARLLPGSTTGPTAAQVSRICGALRQAGVRDHADEQADFGVPSDDVLHPPMKVLRRLRVPGATQTHSDQDLAEID